MKVALFLLLAAPVLVFLDSAEARNRHSHNELLEELNRNSIYRNNEQVFVRAHRDHKVYGNLEKDTSNVLVEDANGNVQQSTRISVTNNHESNDGASLFATLKKLFL